jgi:hypothetical protein
MAGDIAQMVKGLPSKPEALSSKHQYYFKKKKKEPPICKICNTGKLS